MKKRLKKKILSMKHHQKMKMRKMHCKRQTMSDKDFTIIVCNLMFKLCTKKDVGKIINVFMLILCIYLLYIINFVTLMF